MTFGEAPVLALFDRGTPNERAKEIKFSEFIGFLGQGYVIIDQNTKTITIRKTVGEREKTITIYVPLPDNKDNPLGSIL